MTYKPEDISKMLLTKLEMSQEVADHAWYKLQFAGLPPIRTKLGNHKKDIGPKLEGRISKQLRVRKNFFVELMSCSKNLADYEKQVRKDPYPPFDVLFV